MLYTIIYDRKHKLRKVLELQIISAAESQVIFQARRPCDYSLTRTVVWFQQKWSLVATAACRVYAITSLNISVSWRVPRVEQEKLNFPEHMIRLLTEIRDSRLLPIMSVPGVWFLIHWIWNCSCGFKWNACSLRQCMSVCPAPLFSTFPASVPSN